jgi:hypothetical protein
VLVAELLHGQKYSLQADRKTKEGASHPDRNAQFEHINAKAAEYLRSGQPTISVDTKKKEQAGDYKNGGREWRPKGQPELVEVHDFAKQKDIPYGVYDPGQNADWVSVGTDRDTSAFAFKAGWTQANTRKGSRWASRSLPPFNCAPTLSTANGTTPSRLVLNATAIFLQLLSERPSLKCCFKSILSSRSCILIVSISLLRTAASASPARPIDAISGICATGFQQPQPVVMTQGLNRGADEFGESCKTRSIEPPRIWSGLTHGRSQARRDRILNITFNPRTK